MAEDNKKRRKRTKTSGRVTAKGTQAKQSGRYTPPAQDPYKPSSRWVPITMFGFFGIGVLVIILNYLPGHLLPGSQTHSEYYLLGGLGCVCLGFVAATRYR